MTLTTLAMAIGGFGAAIAIGIIGHGWLTGISRNPQAAKEMFTPGIIALALAEFVALLSFVIAFLK
jgi:F-type H+-transporting ATPase subunit c